LLDAQGIQKTVVSKNGKRELLNTHTRIEKLANKEKSAADYLMAIKWLGNSGSHGHGKNISREDLLGGFELFEASIEVLYLKRQERLSRLAAEISKRKGKAKRAAKKSWWPKK